MVQSDAFRHAAGCGNRATAHRLEARLGAPPPTGSDSSVHLRASKLNSPAEAVAGDCMHVLNIKTWMHSYYIVVSNIIIIVIVVIIISIILLLLIVIFTIHIVLILSMVLMAILMNNQRIKGNKNIPNLYIYFLQTKSARFFFSLSGYWIRNVLSRIYYQ